MINGENDSNELANEKYELSDKFVSSMEKFFPNQTVWRKNNKNLKRELGVVKIPYSPSNPVPCVKCQNLDQCKSLNGFQIQEVYYPNNLAYRETCNVIESLGVRQSSELFGNGRTFRDTPQCREIVMQYLCLFYGSNNAMYTNYCIFQEDYTPPKVEDQLIAPRPPCRSFCVQIATVCANDPLFVLTCGEIKCPPTEQACTPDPKILGQTLAANLGCALPYDANPYFKSAALHNYNINIILLTSIISMLILITM